MKLAQNSLGAGNDSSISHRARIAFFFDAAKKTFQVMFATGAPRARQSETPRMALNFWGSLWVPQKIVQKSEAIEGRISDL